MPDESEEVDDVLEACDADFGETPDDDLDGITLFAGVPEDEVETHAAALREVLG